MSDPKERPRVNGDTWKYVLAGVLGVSGGGGAATIFAGPSREEVRTMIQAESPYVKDKSAIHYRLETIDKKLDKLLEKREDN